MATFTVKKRMVSVGRDYDVHDERGTACFTIDGKFRFARTFDVKDAAGQVLYSAKEQLLSVDQTFHIDPSSASRITVRRTTTAAVYPMTFEISMDGATQMQAHGSFFRDGIEITRDAHRLANVSREPNTVVAEIFRVWTADDADPGLMLALAMVIIEGDPSRGVPAGSSTS